MTPTQDLQAEKKALVKGLVIGAVAGGAVVACMKDDSDTIKEIMRGVTRIATSYYGCKFLYEIFA